MNIDAWWANATVVLNGGDYATIKKNFACALGVESKSGNQFFICQKLRLNDGSEYILERYKHETFTLFYRRVK